MHKKFDIIEQIKNKKSKLKIMSAGMVFLDETGQRWKTVKKLSTALGFTSVIPILILVLLGLFYLPNWQTINVIKPKKPNNNPLSITGSEYPGNFVNAASSGTAPENGTAAPASQTNTTTSTGTEPTSTTSSTASALPVENASTSESAAAPAAPVAGDTTTVPGNSDTGRNRKKPTQS